MFTGKSRRAVFHGIVAVAVTPFSTGAAFAQALTDQQLLQRFQVFWEQPDITLLPAMMNAWERLITPDNGAGKIAAMGFLGGLFEKDAAAIDPFEKAIPGARTQEIILIALLLASRNEKSGAFAKSWKRSALKGPTFAAIKVVAPATFDLMWAASFATGDAKFPRRIWDFLAATARDSSISHEDLHMLSLRTRLEQTAIKTMADKYGPEKFRTVVAAGSALWSMRSNARQHSFVQRAVFTWLADAPDAPEAKLYRMTA